MSAEKPVRRAQLISTFGVGGMIDFPRDESLMTAGLDAWPFARERCPDEWIIIEERLQARLGVGHFRMPPDFRTPGPGIRHASKHIPFVRFPRWHYCPREGVMKYLSIFGGARERCVCRAGMRCANIAANRRPYLIPVRIIAACERGHIQDFPFIEWVHEGQNPGPDHQLQYVPGRSSASLASIWIRCSCGTGRSLASAFDFDPQSGGSLRRLGIDCAGHRPWLGESDGLGVTAPESPCGAHLRVLQRGASNVHFPQTFSSIYLPLWGEGSGRELIQAIEDPAVWETLSNGLDGGRLISRDRCEIVARLRQLDADALYKLAQRRLDGLAEHSAPITEEEYRRHEYDAFREARGDINTDFEIELKDSSDYGSPVSNVLVQVGLVRKLRETRALAGFTRIYPPVPDDVLQPDGPGNQAEVQSLSLDRHLGWLPAIVVRGEGIFLEVQESAINQWLATNAPARRIATMVRSYNQRRRQRMLPPRALTPKFVLLHSLAHMLIRQLSFDCGYGSASLRERIYCEQSTSSPPMQGILIYTASGDSEGTMGGLVRQGQPARLESTFLAGLQALRWCSYDPVCIESTGQGADNANLAACHGCMLLSETSCEEGNRLLDRGLVVGRLDDHQCGMFPDPTL